MKANLRPPCLTQGHEHYLPSSSRIEFSCTPHPLLLQPLGSMPQLFLLPLSIPRFHSVYFFKFPNQITFHQVRDVSDESPVSPKVLEQCLAGGAKQVPRGYVLSWVVPLCWRFCTVVGQSPASPSHHGLALPTLPRGHLANPHVC